MAFDEVGEWERTWFNSHAPFVQDKKAVRFDSDEEVAVHWKTPKPDSFSEFCKLPVRQRIIIKKKKS